MICQLLARPPPSPEPALGRSGLMALKWSGERKMKRCFCLAICFAYAAAGQSFQPASNGIYSGTMTVVHRGHSKPIQIVLDTPEIRQLVAAYEAKTAEINQVLAQGPSTFQKRAHQISPGRTEFLAAMASAPHITVRENTRVRVLEISKAGCTSFPEATVTYLRVVITNGTSKGQQAWICRNPYSLPFERP